MVPPRRPNRPGRASGSSSRRPPPPPQDDELLEGEEGELDEAPQQQQPNVTMMVGLGAALVFAILFAIFIFRKRGFLVEVENLSDGILQKVVVKINDEAYVLGDLRQNEIDGTQARCTPGDKVEVEYFIPVRGANVRTLPKKDTDGNPSAPDFAEFKGQFRIRLSAEGIVETLY